MHTLDIMSDKEKKPFATLNTMFKICSVPRFNLKSNCRFDYLIRLKHFADATLKVQSCKLCNNKYMIASTQITTTEIFAFIAVIVFNLLGRKVLFINRKDNRNR